MTEGVSLLYSKSFSGKFPSSEALHCTDEILAKIYIIKLHSFTEGKHIKRW